MSASTKQINLSLLDLSAKNVLKLTNYPYKLFIYLLILVSSGNGSQMHEVIFFTSVTFA